MILSDLQAASLKIAEQYVDAFRHIAKEAKNSSFNIQ